MDKKLRKGIYWGVGLSLPLWIFLIGIVLLLTGCATARPPEVVKLPPLTVYLYDGFTSESEHPRGFYRPSDNSIHCLKWDLKACGHELFHALALRGNPPLDTAGNKHFEVAK